MFLNSKIISIVLVVVLLSCMSCGGGNGGSEESSQTVVDSSKESFLITIEARDIAMGNIAVFDGELFEQIKTDVLLADLYIVGDFRDIETSGGQEIAADVYIGCNVWDDRIFYTHWTFYLQGSQKAFIPLVNPSLTPEQVEKIFLDFGSTDTVCIQVAHAITRSFFNVELVSF